MNQTIEKIGLNLNRSMDYLKNKYINFKKLPFTFDFCEKLNELQKPPMPFDVAEE